MYVGATCRRGFADRTATLGLMHYPLQAGREADYRLPLFRIPTEKALRAMQPASKRRLQLDRHPMIAIHILTQKLPDRIFK